MIKNLTIVLLYKWCGRIYVVVVAVVVESGGDGMWWWWWNVVVAVVVECGGEQNKESYINKMYFIYNNIQQQHMYNNKTLQQVYVHPYTFYLKKHIQVYVQLFTVLFKQYPHILAPG